MTEDTKRVSRALEAAEIAKLEAETANLGAELKIKQAEIKIKQAEARQKAAHALSAEFGAEQMRIQTAATQRQEKITLASNHHHHVYNFIGAVYEESVENCLTQLAVWDRLDPACEIEIRMNSQGGSVIDGMYLFDEITNLSLQGGGSHKITMVVRGWAASMAAILLQSADVRRIGKESYLMIHEVSSMARGKIGEILDEVSLLELMSERVAQIFVNRAKGISLAQFKKNWERKDWYLDSQKALKYGFVDEVG